MEKNILHKFFNQFFHDNAGVTAVLFVIVMSCITGIVSFTLYFCQVLVDKNAKQHDLDLAVLSARIAYEFQMNAGLSKEDSMIVANKTVNNIYKTNSGANTVTLTINDANNEFNVSFNSCITTSLNTLGSATKCYDTEASANSDSTTSSIFTIKSAQVVFALDQSYSMTLSVDDGVGGTIQATEALRQAAAAGYNTMFSYIDTPAKLDSFAASHLYYSNAVRFRLLRATNDNNFLRSFLDNEPVINADCANLEASGTVYTDNNPCYFGTNNTHVLTNTYEGVKRAIEDINKVSNQPANISNDHTKYLVLMSDGVPTRTIRDELTYEHWTCDCVNPRRVRTNRPLILDGIPIFMGWRWVIECESKPCSFKTFNNFSGDEVVHPVPAEQLEREAQRIIGKCQEFKDADPNNIVLSVFFKTDNVSIDLGKRIMRQCASSTASFYDVSNAASLRQAFIDIGSTVGVSLDQVRTSLPVRLTK